MFSTKNDQQIKNKKKSKIKIYYHTLNFGPEKERNVQTADDIVNNQVTIDAAVPDQQAIAADEN